ncbi:MAG: phosphatidylserine decarboxylase, partial [Alistipes sp.]|nr:phosphatidylserine decarboxylase [Candidatus Minthomonas equi]
PLSGTIKEIEVIAGDDAAGGITVWDKESGNYILECETPGWQMIETRGRIILETPEFGLVALLPIGMSQVSSVNFESHLHPESVVRKGDLMGWFDMGGSDFVLLFQKGVKLDLQVPYDKDGTYQHMYQGNAIGTLSK